MSASDIPTALNALKLARSVHRIYDSTMEDIKKQIIHDRTQHRIWARRGRYHAPIRGYGAQYWNNYYQSKFGDGFCAMAPTKPNVLIVQSYYGIAASRIYTPLGKIHISGSGGGSPEIHKKVNAQVFNSPDFKLVLLKEEDQTDFGCDGPYYAVKSIGDSQFTVPASLDDAFAEPAENLQSICDFHRTIFEEAYKQGILRDQIGAHARLLRGVQDPPSILQEVLMHSKNPHACDKIQCDHLHYKIECIVKSMVEGTGIDYEAFHSLIAYTYLLA